MSTIPASSIVNVTPNVLSAGGSALDLSGLVLTENARVPIGSVQSFVNAAVVQDFFGASSQEAAIAGVYFAGFDNSNVKPGAILFAQYPSSAVSAYLRGGNVSGLTIAELQAIAGTLSVVIDSVLKSATIDLAAATSFSNAANLIADGLGISGVQAAVVTGSIAGTTLTVSSVASGALAVGQVLSGTGVTLGTYITALASGTGGTGTYTVSDSQTALSQTITAHAPAVQYDSVSGAFVIYSGTTGDDSTLAFGSGAMATSLLLTSLTGAVLSQGADAATPGPFMVDLTQVTQNWATFMTAFDPDDGSGNTLKLALAAWTSLQNNRYAYMAWDTDASPTTTVPATASLGYLIGAAAHSGTSLIYALDDATGPLLAAFVCGSIASIDFTQNNGRTTLAFRSQAGLSASASNETVATNLIANGYNFYGAYATADENFVFLYPGIISGDFRWLDSYINQIWLNNAFQLALLNLLTQVKSIPYNSDGYALIEAACADPINAGLTFGAFRGGVTLSAAQIAEVNSAAGDEISSTLSTRGWYLQVLDASPTVRAARGSPPATFWYVDGESVQSIDLTSVALQ